MAAFLGIPARPKLAPDVVVVPSDEGPVLRTSDPSASYSLGPDGAVIVDDVLPHLDGVATLPEIFSRLQEQFSEEDLVDVLGELSENGLVVEGARPDGPVDGVRCYRALRAIERQAAAARAASRAASPYSLAGPDFERYWRGFTAENLHFAAGAAKKFALASGRYPEHREKLAHFLVDEHDHVLIFRKSARALGLDPAVIMAGPPLPEMAALSAFILLGTKRHPLCLGWVADKVERGTEALMRDADGTPGTMRKIVEERLARFPEFLELYFGHADIEQAAAHGSYGRDMFAQTPVVSALELERLRDFATVLEALFLRKNEAVLNHYGVGRGEPPRAATNELASGGAPDAAHVLRPHVEKIAATARARARSIADRTRLDAAADRFAAEWRHVQNEWALAALASPALATTFELRYPLTVLAVELRGRAALLGEDAGSASITARSLAAVIAEAAEIDPVQALAQTVLVEALTEAVRESVVARWGADACRPLRADRPDVPGGAAAALDALGPIGAPSAQAVGVHLQVVAELFEAWLESLA